MALGSSMSVDQIDIVDVLKSEDSLARVLSYLGIDPGKPVRDNTNIHCPWPSHKDSSPSCTVRADRGYFFCQSADQSHCGALGDGEIFCPDLLIECGKASDRNEAMNQLKELFGYEDHAGRRRVGGVKVDDPSLSVATYLDSKGLPEWIAPHFELADVKIWFKGKNDKITRAAYSTGWFGAVLMPMSDGRRPRVRTAEPVGNRDKRGLVKWASKVKSPANEILGDWSLPAPCPDDVRFAAQGAYGFDQFGISGLSSGESFGPSNVLLVVEGESDPHALHAMGITRCLGVPGAKYPDMVRDDLVAALLVMSGGDTDLSALTVVVWQESGEAGQNFPRRVAEAINKECEALTLIPPRIATLPYSVAGAYDDPCEYLQHVSAEHARVSILAGIDKALASSAPLLDACASQPSAAPAPLHVSQAEFDARDPESDIWAAPLSFSAPPDPVALTMGLEELGVTYNRNSTGWTFEKYNSKKDSWETVRLCTPFVVERVESSEGALAIVAAAPCDGEWLRARVPFEVTADSRAATKALAAIKVGTADGQSGKLASLLFALADRMMRIQGKVERPLGVGWAGVPGRSLFSGIELEPLDGTAQEMFRANVERRKRLTDTPAAAREWFDQIVAPMTPQVGAELSQQHAAPMVTIGTAAAATLIGPLEAVGSDIAPVVWMSGLGGQGKTLTQRVAASIFAPRGSQRAYVCGSNISKSALDARARICRDVPLVLDDVSHMPAMHGSSYRGLSAKIEAAASLAMQIFNKDPNERGTKEGGLREAERYRITALFSSEGTVADADVAISAGNIRRISTLRAAPISDFCLPSSWAETVGNFTQSHGGAAGDLLVVRVRDVVQRGELKGMLDYAVTQVEAQAAAVGQDIERTQLQSLAISGLGFALLRECCTDFSWIAAIDEYAHALGPYLAADFADGGAASNQDIAGVELFLERVTEFSTVHGARLLSQDHRKSLISVRNADEKISDHDIYGGFFTDSDGQRWLGVMRSGQQVLRDRFGVTPAMINEADMSGLAIKNRVVNFGKSVRCLCVRMDDTDQPLLPPGGMQVGDGRAQRRAEDKPHPTPTPVLPERTAPREDDAVTKLVFEEEEFIVPFDWGTGAYSWPDGLEQCESARMQLEIEIKDDARAEWDGLELLYGDAVKPFPEADSPHWQRITELGHERALWEWTQVLPAGNRVKLSATDEERAELELKMIQHWRVYLMCKMHHPEWFVA